LCTAVVNEHASQALAIVMVIFGDGSGALDARLLSHMLQRRAAVWSNRVGSVLLH
jgi:hypothetical protein